MKKLDRDSFLHKLESLRARLTGEVLHLTESFRTANGETAQSNQSEELSSEIIEQEVTIQMLQSEENVLGKINEAINRLHAGTYGMCDRCQKPIPRPRLVAIPYTKHCVNCARLSEKER